MKESCVFYTALVAQPGTGKTPASNIVKDCLYEIEAFMQVDEKDSKLLNGIFSFFPILIISLIVCLFKKHYYMN